jgi:hypothetical protein
VGSKILHGIIVELKRSKNISASQKIGTSVTSLDITSNFFIFNKKGSMATGLRVEDKLDGHQTLVLGKRG